MTGVKKVRELASELLVDTIFVDYFREYQRKLGAEKPFVPLRDYGMSAVKQYSAYLRGLIVAREAFSDADWSTLWNFVFDRKIREAIAAWKEVVNAEETRVNP